ncbi:MAG: hypothetical protein KJ069_26220 [Anaerolineae bacterium]|nr:hypothetical protein [Anaerolineae bacterium]
MHINIMIPYRFVLLLTLFFLVAACTPTNPTGDVVSVTASRPAETDTATAATTDVSTAIPTTPIANESAFDQLIASLSDSGATVVNNGRAPDQGLFPGDNITLWHLSVNGINVNVFEFSDTADRQAVSQNISPRGDEYIYMEGENSVSVMWDGEGVPHFWARDNLIVNYWGEDTAVLTPLNTVLGQPIAGGSQPYRPEAGSGSIAGIGEYGVSLQYDPYLAANLSAEIGAGRPSTGPDDFLFDVMPDHLAFTFSDSYADDWTLYHQTVNIPDQPQILIFPLEGYVAMNPIASEQIALLADLLRDRPDLPNGALPHLPPPNGHQDLQAQMHYLTFQNGEGMRYLTQFNQEPRQINNQEIYYTFQGITADHAYYIAAFFPVQSNSLPADNTIADDEAFASTLQNYLAQTTADLNALPTTAFTPDLALLDTLIESLLVEPTLNISPITGTPAPPVASATPEATLPDPAELEMMTTTTASPDGRWQAIAAQSEPIVVGDLEKLYVSLTVSDGTTTWTPVAEWRGYGLGYIWPAVYQWSADGRYLYYTNLSSPDGCLYFSNGTDLHRLDVTDGSTIEILPDGKTLNLSLSADESTLAYTSYNGSFVSFVVRDLAMGDERSVAISELGEYAQTGQIHWSEDGEVAVLTLIYDICQPTESSSIVRINLEDMTATTLIPKDDRRLQILDWPNPVRPEIQLIDKEGNSWLLNISSGELALLEATIYTNTDHGYSLQYPKELHLLGNFGVESDSYFSTHAHAGNPLEIGAAGFWVTINLAENPDGLTLSQWTDLHAKPGEGQTLTVAGETAVQVTVDLAAAGEPHAGFAIITTIAHGDQIYTIEGLAQTAEAFARYLRVYQQLLNTFQFLEENSG